MEKNDKFILIRFCKSGGFFVREVPANDVPVSALVNDRRAWQRVNSYGELKVLFLELITEKEDE